MKNIFPLSTQKLFADSCKLIAPKIFAMIQFDIHRSFCIIRNPFFLNFCLPTWHLSFLDFEYDIFISYRQNDNKYHHWVSDFVHNLSLELVATLKDRLSIYFDENPEDGST